QAALAAEQVHAILIECERGEDVAVKTYVAALAEPDMDVETRRLIQTQYESVQAAHDRIRQLRDSANYAHR
ncbi:MAG: PA2169 family four-helix-bundle protein, partial [Opitutaceae bacterium]